jgi:hypothetical protein
VLSSFLHPYLADFIDSRVATEQGTGLASSAPFEEYKVSSVSSSPNAVLDNGVCKSRYNQLTNYSDNFMD